MIQFVRKKHLRDERLLQIILLFSLLRGSPNLLFDSEYPLRDFHERDLPLGSSLGHAQFSSSLLVQELHPKSLDRVLANYQRSVLHDLNSLGDYSIFDSILGGAGRFGTPSHQQQPQEHRGVQAFLLNAETSLGTGPPPPVEGSYVTGSSSPEPMEEESLGGPLASSYYHTDWPRGDLFEDLEFLEAIWKQDVDLGVPQDMFEGEPEEDPDLELATKLEMGFLTPLTKDKDHGEEPMGDVSLCEMPDDKTWAAMMNFTIDSETGELLATNSSSTAGESALPVGHVFTPGDLTRDSPLATAPTVEDAPTSPLLEFNLDEALKLVGLNSTNNSDLKDLSAAKDCEADSGCGDSGCGDSAASSDCGGDQGAPSDDALDVLNDSLDEMIQASQLHPHYPRNFQGRLGGLVRTGSMEQRWQDLASLLSLPSSDPAHHAQSPPTPTMASHAHTTSPVHVHAHPPPPPLHHPHALYPPHEGASVGAAGTTPPVPRGVLIHNATLPPPMPDAHNITYTNSIGASSHLVASSMNLTNNSDMPGPDHHHHHHYKMETSSTLPPDMMYYQSSGTEMNQTTDGFLSSILNDEDLQLMDIPMTDYNGRGGGDYGGGSYRYGPPEDPHRMPPVAQKKHQMFGKRFFQENPQAGGPPNNLGANGNNVGPGVPLVNAYPPHYPPTQGNTPMEGATAMDPTEMKYSCTMDFRPEVSGATAVDHVQHNHTYHMSPEGPSGINRPNTRDKKGRKSEIEKNLTRDEKRGRTMNLPITCEDIINLPMDEFNERISKYDLTEAQLSLIRDIRRRGKNKVAAQNCRKRKLDQIVHLAEEVKVIQYRKNELCSQLDHLSSERARIKHKFSMLYRHIFQSLKDPDGNPYSPHEYSLQQSADGSILLVPRSSPPHSMDQASHHKGRPSKEDSGH